MAEALALAQRPGAVAVGLALQQQHAAVGAQHRLQRRLPAGVGDLDDLGEAAVGDALLFQQGAKAADFRVARWAAAALRGAQRLGTLLVAGDERALVGA